MYKKYETPEKKPKRITKRKPKIKPKKIISADRLRMIELKKQSKKRIAKEKKKAERKVKAKSPKSNKKR